MTVAPPLGRRKIGTSSLEHVTIYFFEKLIDEPRTTAGAAACHVRTTALSRTRLLDLK